MCPGRNEAFERANNISQERLELLFNQLVTLHLETGGHKDFDELMPEGILKKFHDLEIRSLSLYGDGAYLSFWFCMDSGIQFDVDGIEGKAPRKIDLSWGEPGTSSYTVKTVWSEEANNSE